MMCIPTPFERVLTVLFAGGFRYLSCLQHQNAHKKQDAIKRLATPTKALSNKRDLTKRKNKKLKIKEYVSSLHRMNHRVANRLINMRPPNPRARPQAHGLGRQTHD